MRMNLIYAWPWRWKNWLERKCRQRQDPDAYPMRRMDNRERRACWAIKHFLEHDASPNGMFDFTIEKHGTGRGDDDL